MFASIWPGTVDKSSVSKELGDKHPREGAKASSALTGVATCFCALKERGGGVQRESSRRSIPRSSQSSDHKTRSGLFAAFSCTS